MSFLNNNKANARFNPNRKDDRLVGGEVTSRREHKVRKEVKPETELISTDPAHVLSMPPETRVDWLQMAMMQAALGKLKPTGIYEVIKAPGFKPNSSAARKPLRAMVLANLHLLSQKQKKSLEEARARAKAHWDKELAKPLGSKPAYGMLPKNVGCTYWSNSIQYSQVTVSSETNYDLKVTGGAPGNAKVNFSPAPYR